MDWIEEARQEAAQCWCDDETQDRVMDAELAEAVAKRIAAWIETAAQNQRNTDYYRGLVVKCGETIGDEAYIQDDGGVCEDVLCAKVPELVVKMESLLREVEAAAKAAIKNAAVEDYQCCSQCGSRNISEIGHEDDFGSYKCNECNYTGEPGEGADVKTEGYFIDIEDWNNLKKAVEGAG